MKWMIAALAVAAAFLIPSTASAASPCGTAVSPPTHYQHVVWILMENKSYNSVIGSSSAPYETSLAQQCGSDTHWNDAGSAYNSLPNYIALTSGINSSSVLNPFKCDCNPSSSVHVTSDNIFRQVRTAGGTERSYEEGMSANCGTSGTRYKSKHNPAEYYWGGSDRTACKADDVPLTQFNPNALPTFTFVTPDLCHDTHDCSVNTGDKWLSGFLPPIFNSAAYQSGNTAVFVIWDENSPIPNIVAAPAIKPIKATQTVSHYSALRATEEMLGLPLLGAAKSATDLRSVFGL